MNENNPPDQQEFISQESYDSISSQESFTEEDASSIFGTFLFKNDDENNDTTTCLELLKNEHYSKYFLTGTALDTFLPLNGIKNGEIIEICGLTQAGKTFLMITCALNILANYKHEEVVFISTNFDLNIEEIMKKGDLQMDETKQILSRIHIFKISTFFELITALSEEIIEKKASIIFIDTITVPLVNVSMNVQAFCYLSKILIWIAKKYRKTVRISFTYYLKEFYDAFHFRFS